VHVTLHYDKANVFTAAFNKLTGIHFPNQSNSTSLLFYLNIVLEYSRPHFINIWSFTDFQGDDTRGCGDTICPPEDEQRAARNMLRIVV